MKEIFQTNPLIIGQDLKTFLTSPIPLASRSMNSRQLPATLWPIVKPSRRVLPNSLTTSLQLSTILCPRDAESISWKISGYTLKKPQTSSLSTFMVLLTEAVFPQMRRRNKTFSSPLSVPYPVQILSTSSSHSNDI